MGFVYVVLQENTGLLKIGVTGDLDDRIRTLRNKYGEILLLTWLDGGRDEERRLHEEYAQERVQGEWFDSDRLLLDALEGRLERGETAHPIHMAGRYFACQQADAPSVEAEPPHKEKA